MPDSIGSSRQASAIPHVIPHVHSDGVFFAAAAAALLAALVSSFAVRTDSRLARRSAFWALSSAGVALLTGNRSLRRTALPESPRRKYSLARRTLPDRFTTTSAIRGEWTGNFRSTPSP